jgi:hypothetical protein
MNSADLVRQLKNAAAKATPGPWNTWNDGDSWSVATMSMTTKNTICYIYGNRAQSQKPNDARFIAVCSPDNITALLERIEALEAAEARAARLEAEREQNAERWLADKSSLETCRDVLRKAKAFHDRDEGLNGFTADYEILRAEIDDALDVKEAG